MPTINARPKGVNTIPHDVEAEAGALGCILGAGSGKMLAQLELADFHDLRHRTIFRALLSVEGDNKPLDQAELYERLKFWEEVEDAGGVSYLTELIANVPSEANFPTYLATVKDRAARRSGLANNELERARLLDLSIPITAKPGLLEGRRFDPVKEPPPIKAIYSLAGHAISTPGNLTTITSAVKTGKSAVIGAMAAAAMPHPHDADLLGFSSSNPEGRGLLWLDSEQSADDFWHCVQRAIVRAGIANPPKWLAAFCLTGLGSAKAWAAAREAIRLCREAYGGLHSVLLDGAADFVADVNDPEESNAFVAELHGLAGELACPIIGVVHFNPGGDKTRGHLGSQLERKAETNLRLDKADGSTEIWSDKQRRAPIPEGTGPRFRWDDGAGMHVSTATKNSSKDQVLRESLLCEAKDIFDGHPALRYSDIKTTLMTLGSSRSTAERKITDMKRLAVIVPSVANLYVLANETGS